MLRVAFALFLVALLLTSSIHGVAGQPALPPVVVPGLERPVQVLVDEWGVPHIYAERLYDAFAAQGFIAARDRLWQIDLWRKRGLGEMAKDFGPAYVESDRMARAVLFRGRPVPRVARVCLRRQAHRRGVRRRRQRLRRSHGAAAGSAARGVPPARLPPVALAGRRHRPHPAPRADAEPHERDRSRRGVLQGRARCAARRLAAPRARPRDRAHAAGWPRPVRAAVRSASPGVRARDRPPAVRRQRRPRRVAAPRRVDLLARSTPDDAVAAGIEQLGRRARDGAPPAAPILASDPHRAHGAPSLRYISHLVAPGLDVIGAGEPFLPGISIGHNEAIAFGLTRFYIDQEDLYVYETNPERPGRVPVQGALGADGDDHRAHRGARRSATHGDHRLHASRSGARDRSPRRIARSRCARRGSTSGMAPYFGAIDYMRARNWDQFAPR